MSPGPQQPRAPSRTHRDRDKFIASIDPERVLELASSHHGGDKCCFFKESAHGSFNVCYLVRFGDTESDGEKWVVRVPLAACLAFGAACKLESEVATMQLIAGKTSIPIPRIVAYVLADQADDPLSSFLILEYVDGQKLNYERLKSLSAEQETRLYTALADIYIQLRRLEFPSTGLLTHGPDGFRVSKPVATIDTNTQELKGLLPSKIQASYYGRGGDGLLASANDYVAMLLEISDNAFVESHDSVWEQSQGEEALYHHAIFRQYAEKWVDTSLDRGPFVLVHGGLELFNLIVNDDMDIASVLDWEWSRVVPRQFFKPPLWFGIPDTTKLAYKFVYQDYLTRFDRFLDIVRSREQDLFSETRLADEWSKAKEDSGFLVANALENWTDMDWFAYRYINLKCYGGKGNLAARVAAFMDEDPSRKNMIARKVPEGIAYRARLAENQQETPNDPFSVNDGGAPLAENQQETPKDPSGVSDGGNTQDCAETSLLRAATVRLPSRLGQLWQNTVSYPASIQVSALGGMAIVAAGASFIIWRHLFQYRH